MAVVNEVVAVFESVLKVVSKIADVKEDWFTVSGEYQSEATILRIRLKNYEEQVCIHQQPTDSTMMKILKKGEVNLKKAEARLESLEKSVNSDQCCSQLWWLYAKLSLTFLPQKLESTLKKVNEELDRIPKILKDEDELSGLMQKADAKRALSTIVHDNDGKYVPIKKSEADVIQAIEDTQGPAMILLHGGVGKGKSTLARNMCKLYGKSGVKRHVFDHVIVVSCETASISDLATKQYEILEYLSPSSLTEESSKTGKTDGLRASSKDRIATALKNFMVGKKILMVLDGVSDNKFLYKMWEVAREGGDDKILITSQKSNLCDDFKDDSVAIPMEKPSKEEARKILASLVGLKNQTILPHLLEIANKMIKATDRNPLALACLASSFSYSPNKHDQSEWQAVWMELSTQLDNKDSTIVLGLNSETAPRSLCETMKLCIDSLDNKHAKSTLFLMYACKGESVPEEVLRILCDGMKITRATFNRSKNELWMRELLKPSAESLASKIKWGNEQNDIKLQESPAWSLQSLVKLYMERHVVGKQEILTMMKTLLGDDDFSAESSITCKQDSATEKLEIGPETEESEAMRMRIALCALYFDRHHNDQLVRHAVTKASKRSNLLDSDDTINDLRRKSVEPFVWLLDKLEEGYKWTKFDKRRVRKVLLDYISKRQLDSQNISYLLKLAVCPSAQLATLDAITHISSIEETPLLNENTISFVPAILDLLNLKEGVHTCIQEAASRALYRLCWKAAKDQSALLVAKIPGVMDVLVQSLAIPVWKSDAFAENSARALMGLAFSEEGEIEKMIVNKQGILVGLVNSLSQQSKPSLQIAAAGALANLACARDASVRLGIVAEERALAGVVNCLSNLYNDELQIWSARILAALARVDVITMAILKRTKGLVQALTSLVGDHVPPDTRNSAVEVLFKIDPTAAKEVGLLSAQLDVGPLSHRIFVKAEFGDFQGALDDANKAITMSDKVLQRAFILQERGVLKRIMGDLVGALADLDEALQIEPNDYEMLMHRGYVKFLLNDVEGARGDAETALRIVSSKLNVHGFLAATPVEYLGYKL